MSKGITTEFLHAFFAALFKTLFVPVETNVLDPEIDIAKGNLLVRFDQSNLSVHHCGKEWHLTNSLPRMTVVDHWGELRQEVEALILNTYGAVQFRTLFIEEDSRTEHQSHVTAALAINVFIAKMILIGDCELEISANKEYAWFRLIRPIGGRMTISSSMVIYP